MGGVATENAFELSTSAIRFGVGVSREVGVQLAELSARHALVFTDPVLRRLAARNVVARGSPRASASSPKADPSASAPRDDTV